jgi:hypothetical protein
MKIAAWTPLAAQVHAAFLAALKSYGQVMTTAEILTQLKG